MILFLLIFLTSFNSYSINFQQTKRSNSLTFEKIEDASITYAPPGSTEPDYLPGSTEPDYLPGVAESANFANGGNGYMVIYWLP